MQKILCIVVLVAAVFISWSVNGAEQGSTTKASPRGTLSSSQIDQKSENEVVLLKEQNKLIREYQGSLLDTVYWALGGVFATAALLAGFGWWSNFKLYEADKQRLQQDLSLKINELEAKLALRLETNRTELERAVDAKNDTQFSRLLSELTDVRTNIAILSSESNKRHEEIQSVDAALKTEISKVRIDGLNTSANLSYVEEKVWDLRGVPENILITQCEGIDAALAAGDNADRINLILLRMKEILRSHYPDSVSEMNEDTFRQIQNTISKLGTATRMQAGEILELLDKIKVTKSV